ncbi:amidohydrolase [Hyalangium rubrum]|uniref:Amidohydrolase n=1 Tax=Hyalangium rubrum TaxID=3103134 RepID=A0ABU5GZD5_9BACT|nr:amidohydrolase [Hyalangium sp. s54d21]MDY7225205.1 amidohydrolase [Hyalangium sp. s54d21]
MRLHLLLALLLAAPALAQSALSREVERHAASVEAKVVGWRRDLHAHPELSNQETRTAQVVAEHLRRLGLEVRTGVGGTGVVGVLRGARPGPVVALRADMDALPVTEEVDLPFKSTVRTQYNGQEVGVMHACGHDTHVAMLMGAAEVLASMRATLPGTVKFIFQPAEEASGTGPGGALAMLRDGVLENPAPSAIFGLHVFSGYRTGEVDYRPGGVMASSDGLSIVVRGSQTHGAMPWAGVDPIVVASQIVLGLQTVVSRQVDLTASPAIVTIGSITGGVRGNIIPDTVTMSGTIRTFDQGMRQQIHERVRRVAEGIAQSAGATAEVKISLGNGVTQNDPALVERMRPTVRRVAGKGMVTGQSTTTSEDFSAFQARIPGVFLFLGVTPEGKDLKQAAPNHSPRFFVDERALPVGVRLLSNLAVDYLEGTKGQEPTAKPR